MSAMIRLFAAFSVPLVATAMCTGCDEIPTTALDYSDDGMWLALPQVADPADDVPLPGALAPELHEWLEDRQSSAAADVFYVHPTTYIDTLKVGNAPLNDTKSNEAAEDALRYQASAFNAAGRVFAPRYRQASLMAYAVPAGGRNAKVLDAAYMDVLAAFDDYVSHRSDGRPFLLVGHSQGGDHVARLIAERIEGTDLKDRLVAAYVMGELVGPDSFSELEPCASADSTGCVISWATVADGAAPALACGSADLSACVDVSINTSQRPFCIDPLTWTSGGSGSADLHLGAGPGLGMGSGSFDGLVGGLLATGCDEDGLLRIDDSHTVAGVSPRDFADVQSGDYHVQDINLFWMDIRINADERVRAWHDVAGR